MRLTVLGKSPSWQDADGACSGYLIEARDTWLLVDRGHGVSDADKERIFAAFQRAGDAPQGDGLGLGLAVARGLMNVMGGSLVAEDTPGGGLTMLIELPLAPQAAQQEKT